MRPTILSTRWAPPTINKEAHNSSGIPTLLSEETTKAQLQSTAETIFGEGQQLQLQQADLRVLQDTKPPTRGVPEEDPHQQALPGHQWSPVLAQGQCRRQHKSTTCCTNSITAGFSIQSLMEPLCQAPFVIPQLIMSLCSISIATCNKLCEIMMPFHGDKNDRE
jgi:hypothetical protein